MQIYIQAKRFCFAQMVKISPVLASRLLYLKTFKRMLNLQQPQTFNEKLMWLKLYEDSTYKTKYTDRVEVRKYVQVLGFGSTLVPIIQTADRVQDVSFEQLPKQFVMKCSHGSDFTIICTDKKELDFAKAKQQLMKWMETDYSLMNAETHYAKIKPRIIVEHFLSQENGKVPIDYQIHCFHGEPKIIELIVERFTPRQRSIMLTPDWKNTNYIEKKYAIKIRSKPKQLNELIAISKKLSKAFTYVRVDMYIVDEKIYFDKLTFTPAACMNTKIHEQADQEIGEWIQLPPKENGETNIKRVFKNLLHK